MSNAENQLESLVRELKQRELAARRRTILLSAIPITLACLLLVFSFLQIQLALRRVQHIQDELEKIQDRWALAGTKFTITQPANGETVPFIVLVKGMTPFFGMNHYVVVTPIESGTNWVQEPATVDAGGAWVGQAFIGDNKTAVGRKFIVRCLATESQLRAGPLSKMPEDAVLSAPIIITRGDR